MVATPSYDTVTEGDSLRVVGVSKNFPSADDPEVRVAALAQLSLSVAPGQLVALIGPARTKELMFTARLADAEEGKAIGLFNEIVEADRLEQRTFELAEHMAELAPLTLRAAKETVRRILERARPEDFDDLILSCYMSEDFKEGVAAFLEKRPPRWTGR